MRELAHRIVHARRFEYLLVFLILGSAIMQGVGISVLPEEIGTSDQPLDWFHYLIFTFAMFWLLTVAVLVLEALLKMIALSPRIDRYFRNGWNAFDFLAIGFLIISIAADLPLVSYGFLLISVRLLRLLRGLSTVQDLQLILSTLFRSLPGLGHIMVLMGIVLYSFALVGYFTFGEHDPENWGSLGVSILSLFRMMTLDDWAKIMQPAVELEPLAWVYFVSFIIVSAFIVVNLFIAIVIKNLDEAIQEHPRSLKAPASREEILRELRSTQQALQRLEERLQQLPD